MEQHSQRKSLFSNNFQKTNLVIGGCVRTQPIRTSLLQEEGGFTIMRWSRFRCWWWLLQQGNFAINNAFITNNVVPNISSLELASQNTGFYLSSLVYLWGYLNVVIVWWMGFWWRALWSGFWSLAISLLTFRFQLHTLRRILLDFYFVSGSGFSTRAYRWIISKNRTWLGNASAWWSVNHALTGIMRLSFPLLTKESFIHA